MTTTYDVLVVGGGPIGAATAREAAQQGACVGLVERRDTTNGPAACTGLVTPRTLDTLEASDVCVLRTIRAVDVLSPTGRVLSLRSSEPKAVVIDRSILERDLLTQAAAAGVDVRMNTQATSAAGGRVTLKTRGAAKTVSASVIVGADGPHSTVAQWFGLPACEFLPAAQAVVQCEEPVVQDRVTVFVGADCAPGFFAWSVPAEPGRCRIGLATAAGPKAYLDRLLEAYQPNARVLTYTYGSIPIEAQSRIVSGRAILVGDAAGHVKPLSGGGLYFGGLCSRIVGCAAAEAAKTGDYSALRSCAAECDDAIGAEIRFGRLARTALLRLPDTQIDKLFDAVDDPRVLRMLATAADIDYPSRLLRDIRRSPRVLARLLPFVSLLVSRQESAN